MPNRLPSPLWQSVHLMEISEVFMALFAPGNPTFTALRVRTLHPKLLVFFGGNILGPHL